ncbi:MAG: FHA domain-containing protein [Sulfurimicrobium sp.]|nr:FHA domain-containing protein [Sulfurimicrobium sp.]MDP2198866.1 FHA domain-containing protein [Sulfurimicrobium sp.]MDP3687835.1 FHA domain-containing protein [Sulfurimicrobium sp.]
MAKLVLSLDGNVLGYHFLEKERFGIGRKPSNELHIDDSSVSKEHAVIVTVGNDQILEDLGSTNGTLVNGIKIKKHILQNNDAIDIGRYQLRYINQKARPGVDSDRTIMMMPVMNPRRGEGRSETSAQTSGQAGAAVSVARAANDIFPLGGIQGLEGPHAGQTLELNRPLATFGKEGIQVAVINRRPHGYSITRVEGKKQPLVNGLAISEEAQLLQDGDQIEVGGEILRFFLKKQA